MHFKLNDKCWKTALLSGLVGLVFVFFGVSFISIGENSTNLMFELGRCFYSVGWAFILSFCVRVLNWWSVIPVLDKHFDKLIAEIEDCSLGIDFTAPETDKMLIEIKCRKAESYNRTGIMLDCARWISLAIIMATTWGNP